LETRQLLANGSGPGYVLEGNSWPDPTHLTFSFVPDGTSWDGGTSNLQGAFAAEFPGVDWEYQLAKALQTWASVANINFVQVADAGLPFNTPGQAQGDPRFGDIRIGGFAYPNGNTTTLAQTYYPPPGGNTAAGDTEINTTINYSIGGGNGIDLYSVMLHEFGHALGMAHAPDPAQVMYAVYQGVRPGLSSGDIAGIQALYGPRTADAYQSQGQGTSFSTAIGLDGGLSGGQETLGNVSLATIGDVEYFAVTAPAGAGATLQVAASASGSSLLSPKVTVFDASGNVLANAANPAAFGDDVGAQVNGVQAGHRYLIAVTGATGDVFATGAYQLHVAFATGQGSGAATGSSTSGGSPAPAPPSGSGATLTADELFIQALYRDFLGRSGSVPELDSWAALLPTLGQEGVATKIIHSTEAEARQVDRLYIGVLGRAADPVGEAGFVGLLQAGGTLEQVAAMMAGSPEFAARSATFYPSANPNVSFVEGLDAAFLGRIQSPTDINTLLGALPTVGRAGLIDDFLASAEYRGDQVDSYYAELLHRAMAPSPAELAGWVNSGLDLLTIQSLMAGTPEFFADASNVSQPAALVLTRTRPLPLNGDATTLAGSPYRHLGVRHHPHPAHHVARHG
jgi:hypothetical protein